MIFVAAISRKTGELVGFNRRDKHGETTLNMGLAIDYASPKDNPFFRCVPSHEASDLSMKTKEYRWIPITIET